LTETIIRDEPETVRSPRRIHGNIGRITRGEDAAVEAMKAFRKGRSLGGLSIRAMVEVGRRD
jgi:hypothetical protein